MDTFLNPVTQDYQDNGFQLAHDIADGLANAVYLRLMTPVGQFWANRSLGSQLHELQREKDLSRISFLAEQYVQDALQTMLDDERLESISIDSSQLHDGALSLVVKLKPYGKDGFTFTHIVRVF